MGKGFDVPRRPVVLIILDGYGANPGKANNAIAIAETPNFDRPFANNAHTVLQASARSVGLPDGQMGNSEVGHMTLGS
ncbi:MAG: 2,3-bisphosphoglycerate-independent phosphoglycerate mutase, partial [Thiohalocapsa sp.]|nr:2,3-bisphosphoglycerate-independent phosphoglycerate mutase [Thiohalocapsa sp.]